MGGFNLSQIVNKQLDVRNVGGYAKEPFEGNKDVTKTFKEKMDGFVIANDGTADLDVVIHKETYKVKAGGSFVETFPPFTKVSIFTTSPFRAYGINSVAVEENTDPNVLVDNFERANGNLGKADTGQTWELYEASKVASASKWQVNGNKAMVTGLSYNAAVAETGVSDYFVIEADIKLTSITGANPANSADYGGFMFCFNGVQSNLFFRADGLVTQKLILFRSDNISSYARLAEPAFTFTDGQVVHFKLVKKGASIEIFADGVSALTHTLSDADMAKFSGVSKHGMFLKSTTSYVDNFKLYQLEV